LFKKISSCEFFKSKTDSFETTSSVNNLNIVINANNQCEMSHRKSLVTSSMLNTSLSLLLNRLPHSTLSLQSLQSLSFLNKIPYSKRKLNLK